VQRFVDIQNCCIIARDGWRRGIPLRPGDMYVCPRSGLLLVVRQKRPPSPPRRFEQNSQIQFLWRDSAWWEVRLRKRPDDPGELWDAWFERPVVQVPESESIRVFGGKLIAVSKRPLSLSETRNFYRQLRKSRPR
jgi:hypothetical protein